MAAKELNATSLISDANLIAYYRLENGAITTDSKGAYTLTETGDVGESASGKFGGCGDWPGTASNYLHVSDNLGIDGGAISMSAWVKLDAEPAGGGAAWFVQQGSTTSDVQYSIYISEGGGDITIVFLREKVGVGADVSSYVIPGGFGTSAWRHVVLTYDTTNIRGYLDGNLVAGPTAASGNGNAGFSAVNIGARNAADNASNGLIDDVAFFNRVLTPTEISNLYSGNWVTGGSGNNVSGYFEV